jgi:hypothetical protein
LILETTTNAKYNILMAHSRVYADFQNLDDENRLRLTCAGTHRDLEQQALELREGLVLTLYTDDATDDGQSDEILADAVVHFNHAENCWVAAIDWQAIRHASTERKLPRKTG